MIDKKFIKTWFVTGASSGLGYELCNQLIGRGYNVVAISRNTPNINSENVLCLACDVNNHETVQECIKLGIEKFGSIDVLVNNAGITSYLSIEEQSIKEAKQIMETNFWSSFNTMQNLIPIFRNQKYGTIINISSECGLIPRAFGAAYVSSKHALEGLTSVAWWELQRFCRVLCVELSYFPGTNIGSGRNDTTLYEEYEDISITPISLSSKGNINNISKAVNHIINEAEKNKMQRRLMLGHDICEKVTFEGNMLLSDSKDSFDRAKDCSNGEKCYRHYGLKREPSPKDVGILNFQFENENYGAVLTSYALNSFLNKNGYAAVNINYIPNFPWIEKEPQNIHFKNFKRKNLPLTEKYVYGDDLKELNSKFSTFIVGSDQVWRQEFTEKFADRNAYFLSFANCDKKLIACSASFGTDSFKLINKRKRELFNRLSIFDFILVREKSGINLCNKIGINATELIDPVFFLSQNEWSSLANNSTIKANEIQDNLILYTINKDLERNFIDLAQQNKNIINFKNIINITNGISIEDWLFYIKNCKYIITDSYHCVCFAIIFNKPFLCINTNILTNTRIESLLDNLMITNRLYSNFNELTYKEIASYPIDYNSVNNRLYTLSNYSRKTLIDQLSEPILLNEDRIKLFIKHKKRLNTIGLIIKYQYKLKYLKYKLFKSLPFSKKRKQRYLFKSETAKRDYKACNNCFYKTINVLSINIKGK